MKVNRSLLLLISCVLFLAMLTGSAIAKDKKGLDGKKQKVSKSLGLGGALLDINGMDFGVLSDGTLGYNPISKSDNGLYFPADQTDLSILYTGGLWIVGTVNGDIRTAANCYASEFQPGSVSADGIPEESTLDKFQMFKFGSQLNDAGEPIEVPVTAEAIAQGCPADVWGDQMLFCVYNDFGSHAGLNNTNPLGVEVQQTVWGYAQTGALNNTVFIKYRIINKGGNDVDDCYLAIFYDPDLGDSNDDASGADSTNGFGFVYNGDGKDDNYGVTVPAMASDFFQGPVVDAPGETAVFNDGTIKHDMKIMEQTAVFHFLNADGVPDNWGDPASAEGYYYFCQGLLRDGAVVTDPGTGLPTKFWFAGDPVTSSGWLYEDFTAPTDVRFGNATGPFQLAAGDTQDVVLGLVIGSGSDNLNSITVMRYYDRQAQAAYDKNFEIPDPPASPALSIAELDGELVLNWDATNPDIINYAEDGYVFEGFNVWQALAAGGPWVRIATFDKINTITVIWDFAYSAAIGTLLEMPVQMGSDAGLTGNMRMVEDQLGGVPFVNGKPYYYAVTSYAYNNDNTPKTLERSPSAVVAIPQKPVVDVAYNSTASDTLMGTTIGPPTATNGIAVVVDPSLVTGHDYIVNLRFNADSSAVVWDLVDVTTGETKLTDQTNLSGDDHFATVDGVKFIIEGVMPSDYGFDDGMGYYKLGWDYSGSRFITGVDWGGHALFGGLDLGENFWGGAFPASDYANVEVYFWNQASHDADPVAHPWTNCATYIRPGYAFGGVGVFPGAAYDVEDPDNPRRLNMSFVEAALVDLFWNPLEADVSAGTANGGREYLFINSTDYVEDPSTLYNDDVSGLDTDAMFAMWVAQRGSHTSDEEFVLQLFVTHPLTAGQTSIEFSTAGYAKDQNADVAKDRMKEINVFPNPYFAHNSAEGTFYTQFVTFNNLPEECDIRIFSLNGELVKTIEHTDGTPFEKWLLLNEESIPVGSGMYFAHISTEFGNVILKLAIINRGAFFKNL